MKKPILKNESSFLLLVVIFTTTFILSLIYMSQLLINKANFSNKLLLKSLSYSDNIDIQKDILINEFKLIEHSLSNSLINNPSEFFTTKNNKERIYLDKSFKISNDSLSSTKYILDISSDKDKFNSAYDRIESRLDNPKNRHVDINIKKEIEITNSSKKEELKFLIQVRIRNKYGINRKPEAFIEENIKEISIKKK